LVRSELCPGGSASARAVRCARSIVVTMTAFLASKRSPAIACLIVCMALQGALAAPAATTETESGSLADASNAAGLAVINFPEEVDLQVIVDYVGKALDIHFVYDEGLLNKRVQLRPSPVELPKERLLDLLASLLQVRDLILVEQEPGFYRILPAEQSPHTVRTLLPSGTSADDASLRVVTQVLKVPGGRVEEIASQLERFVSSAKSKLIPVPERNLLIVTDYESRIAVLQDLLGLLDAAAPIQTETIAVPAGSAAGIAQQVSAILTETYRLQQQKELPPTLRGDLVPGAVVIIGRPEQLNQARALIEQFAPAETDLHREAYALRHIAPERLQELINNVVSAPGTGLAAPVTMYADQQAGKLYVTAEDATHEAIRSLLEAEDRPTSASRRALRIYTLKNREAADLLATLTQLLGEGATLTEVPADDTPDTAGSTANNLAGNSPSSSVGSLTQVPPTPPPHLSDDVDGEPSPRLARVQGPNYVLTEDAHTNAILAIGPPDFHDQLASLIADLDRRRLQVLIEMKLVAVTMSDSQEIGVELAVKDLGDAWDYLVFSSYGLSTVDVATGQRVLTPGIGANGVLLGPDEVPVVLRALATHGTGKVVSSSEAPGQQQRPGHPAECGRSSFYQRECFRYGGYDFVRGLRVGRYHTVGDPPHHRGRLPYARIRADLQQLHGDLYRRQCPTAADDQFVYQHRGGSERPHGDHGRPGG
jgi:type II secretory pathway component GspD/PulD (secretin)